ncbi:MAG: guanylate kinase [Mycoplasmataceae bacterium]|nr:guanylate kinase [Mycoplasmataceae bacterium]
MNNKLVIFTGPSAVGKATLEKGLFAREDLRLKLSISATTRKSREGEIDGVHYHFISHQEFNILISENKFIEWNEHFSNKYGTLKSEVEKIQNNGDVPFLEIEVIGAMNIINVYGSENVRSIFIAPPSIEEIRDRLKNRGTETLEQIEERIARVKVELEYKDKFQYVVVNDELKKATKELIKILEVSK